MKNYIRKLHNTKTRGGFTLVELLFAMAFLSVLLLVIAYLVIYIITIYQKGLTLRAVSSTGRQLIDDVNRSIITAPFLPVLLPSDDRGAPGIDEADILRARNRYYFQVTSSYEVNGNTNQYPAYGAFCTGSYSYLWNTAYALNSDEGALINFSYMDDPQNTGTLSRQILNDFRLIKIYDQAREICSSAIDMTTGEIDPGETDFMLAIHPTEKPYILIHADEADLALYDFQVLPATQNSTTGQTFYSATFILATLRGGIDIMSNGTFCSEVGVYLSSGFSYCAVNKFNFSMRASGARNPDQGYGN